MGNDLVGQAIEAMSKFRPDKTVMKIWENNKICIILAVLDPKQYETEMDPYYIYTDGKVDGISYLDNADILIRLLKPENMVYQNKILKEN